MRTSPAQVSDDTMELERENKALRAKEKELIGRVEILEASEKELTKRNVSNQKARERDLLL